MNANGDRKARLVEIVLSVVASAIGSAVIVAWTLSATLTQYHEQLEQHQRLIDINSAELRALNSGDRGQAIQLAKQDQANIEIVGRLKRIEDKLDGR